MSTNETDTALYRRDFHAWAQQQGALLRRRADGALVNDSALDWSHIADEIESLGRSEESTLSSMIGTIIEHLMKLQASPATDPRRGWMETIFRTRKAVARHLRKNPGLKSMLATMVTEETPDARQTVLYALDLYGKQPRLDVNSLTYSAEQVLGEWYPPDQ
ncbi:DUF29 domain-containing protein [Rhodopila globiformis]|nr:DUF29 domain-containing protein [Rhodopila globiformis]